MWPAISEIVRYKLSGAPAEVQGCVDAAPCDRRDHARRVADQHDAIGAQMSKRSAAGDEPAASRYDLDFANVEHCFQPQQELAQIRLGRPPRCHSDLRVIDTRHDPGNVTGRNATIREAVQKALVQNLEGFALDFYAGQEVPVVIEAKVLGDVRACAVCSDEKIGMQPKRGDCDASRMLAAAVELAPIEQLGAGPF